MVLWMPVGQRIVRQNVICISTRALALTKGNINERSIITVNARRGKKGRGKEWIENWRKHTSRYFECISTAPIHFISGRDCAIAHLHLHSSPSIQLCSNMVILFDVAISVRDYIFVRGYGDHPEDSYGPHHQQEYPISHQHYEISQIYCVEG